MPNVTITTMDAGVLPLAGSELMEVSQLSASVKITATTLSALASDNSYNDSALGFGSAGFAVGDRVKVIGFTAHTVNNILTGHITALTNGKMTIGGTDGDVIVDNAAGDSVVITKWTTKRASVKDVGAGSNASSIAFNTITSASGVLVADLSKTSTFKSTLTEDITTFTLSNPEATSGYASFFTLMLKQDGTGSRTFANPSSWKFGSGTSFVASTAAGAVDLVQGVSYDNGTTWFVTFASNLS